MHGPGVPDVSPRAAYQVLAKDPDAMLVDVRTDAEWNFVGVPDLSGIGKGQIGLDAAGLPWPSGRLAPLTSPA